MGSLGSLDRRGDGALATLLGRLRPLVTITAPPPGLVVERDVEVEVRDGAVLRVNVHRPRGPGRHPVLLCAHPYGKDAVPRRRRHRWAVPRQYRVMPQSEPLSHSALTSWEAPDPAPWVAQGYVVVNCDLRGWGRSDGVGELFSESEGRDLHDVVEWAAAQPWSNGRVGTDGVSYLALVQWRAAAARPAHLAAACVWEGFSDLYPDAARPGGVREDGFFVVWSLLQRRQRRSPVTLRREQRARPLRDTWWDARAPDLAAVEVPLLVCASFSDHELHSRGSFEGFRRAASAERWLWTHRGPKWATYYGDEASAARLAFFDRHLRGRGDGPGPGDGRRVRVEVRRSRREVHAVRWERSWPPEGTTWVPLHLDAATGRMQTEEPTRDSTIGIDLRRGRASFTWTAPAEVELVGPMWVRLHVALEHADDANLFVVLRKLVVGREVGFEGSFGFRRAPLTRGLRTLSHRDAAGDWPAQWSPAVDHRQRVPLGPGEVVPTSVELLPSATVLAAGDQLRLDVTGRWPTRRDPLTGQFPAGYQASPPGVAVLHTGGGRGAALHVARHDVG